MNIILEIIINILLLVLLPWLMAAASVFVHEMGHAAGYMLTTKGRSWHIIVGSGKRLFATKRFAVNLIPFGGRFLPKEIERLDSAKKQLAMLIGGPLATLILLIPLVILRINLAKLGALDILGANAVKFLANFPLFYNLILLVISLFPAPYTFSVAKGLDSDGLQIYKLLKRSRDL